MSDTSSIVQDSAVAALTAALPVMVQVLVWVVLLGLTVKACGTVWRLLRAPGRSQATSHPTSLSTPAGVRPLLPLPAGTRDDPATSGADHRDPAATT